MLNSTPTRMQCIAFSRDFHFNNQRGMTTNESAKWGQVRKWHKQESKRYQQAVKNGLVSEQKDVSSASSVVTDGDVTCTGAAAPTSTANGQQGDEDTEPPIHDPGPMPKNIYDNGIVENWKEVVYPKSLRQDSLDRWKRSLHASRSTSPDDTLPQQQPLKPKAS